MDHKYIDLFDRYTHGSMPRREILERLAGLAGSAAAATALLVKLENNYALAAMVAEDDPRLLVEIVEFATAKGKASGYLVKQKQVHKVGNRLTARWTLSADMVGHCGSGTSAANKALATQIG